MAVKTYYKAGSTPYQLEESNPFVQRLLSEGWSLNAPSAASNSPAPSAPSAPATGGLPFSRDQINAAYQNILGRDVDAEGLRHFTTPSEFGFRTIGELEADLRGSDEFRNRPQATTPTGGTSTVGYSPTSGYGIANSSALQTFLNTALGKLNQPAQTSKAATLFSDYQTAVKNAPTSASIIDKYNQQYGVQGLQNQLLPINQSIREAQNVLTKVEGDIRQEGQGNVTESQRYSQIAQRQKPINEQIASLFLQKAPMEEQLTNAQNMVAQMSGAEISDTREKMDNLARMIQLNPEIDPNDELKNNLDIIKSFLDIEAASRPEPEAGSELLSPTEAATLGVPYGTTQAQAAAMGITPARYKTSSGPGSPGSPSDTTSQLEGYLSGSITYAQLPKALKAQALRTESALTSGIAQIRSRYGGKLTTAQRTQVTSWLASAVGISQSLAKSLVDTNFPPSGALFGWG